MLAFRPARPPGRGLGGHHGRSGAIGVAGALQGFNWEETATLLGIAVLLAPFRGAFPRVSRLTRMEITPAG
jgi:lysylphosphatidylglycerol synthetase-like protein (DUF2156 family)